MENYRKHFRQNDEKTKIVELRKSFQCVVERYNNRLYFWRGINDRSERSRERERTYEIEIDLLSTITITSCFRESINSFENAR